MSRQQLSDPITLRLPVDVLAEVERIARISDRNRSWIIVRALRHYLAGEGADILGVAEGRQQIAEGDAHDMDDVIREIEAVVRGKVA